MSDALAERLGIDPDADPRPRVLVAAALGGFRSTIAWWFQHGHSERKLADWLDRAFDLAAPDVVEL